MVSQPGFCALKYIACLIEVVQQNPEQYGRCPSFSERWPAHCTKATLFTSLPSDGRLIAPPLAAFTSASSSRLVTTSLVLP